MAQQIHYLVVARVDDEGTITEVFVDNDSIAGSLDGYVWDEDTEQWGSDVAHPHAERALVDMLTRAIAAFNDQLEAGDEDA